MARLPVPGQDDGMWGDVLNDFLSQSHNTDGTLKNNLITSAKLDTNVQASLTAAGTAVQQVNGRSPVGGNVTLAASDVGALTQTTADARYIKGLEQATAPSGPAADDLWYDKTNDVWKRWNGASWITEGGNTYALLNDPGVSKTVSLGTVSGNVSVDVSAGSVFIATVSGATTFTFTNWPTGTVAPEPTIITKQDSTGGRTIAFAGVTWLPNGTAPSFLVGASQVNVNTFFSSDNGTTVYGQGASVTGGGFGQYGDGSDGAVVLDGSNTYSFLGKSGTTYWLLRDTYFSSVTISAGVTLQLGGGSTATFRAYCTGVFTVAAGAYLFSTVNSVASGATGGTNLSTGSMIPGASGPNGGTGAGTAGTNVNGQNGGFAGRGGAASGGTVTSGTNGISLAPAAGLPRALPGAAVMGVLQQGTWTYFQGGASGSAGSGDGTNSGGGGGAGGNPIWIAAQTMVNNGTIQTFGGKGGNATGGNAGGGGGGQGGPVMLIYGSFSGSGTILNTGGAGGLGTGTGSNGASGGVSWVVQVVN